MRIWTHVNTHTHKYIYIYIHIANSIRSREKRMYRNRERGTVPSVYLSFSTTLRIITQTSPQAISTHFLCFRCDVARICPESSQTNTTLHKLKTNTQNGMSMKEMCTSIHTIPYHTIPYHTIPYHTIPCHAVPYLHIYVHMCIHI